MKNSFDLFGEALLAYSRGKKSRFFFEDEKGILYEQPISSYLASKKPFTKLERKMVSLSYGKILDIGCGAGGFIPELMKKGNVFGIDISSTMIKICRKRGINNVKVADIFKFKTKNKFDTILLLDENVGLAENVRKTKKLLKVLSNLLSENGQILANIEEVKGKNYSIWKARAVWNNKKGPWFKWIKLNSKLLRKLCNKQRLKCEIVKRDGKRYIARVKRLK